MVPAEKLLFRALCLCVPLLIIHGAAAFTVGSVSVSPAGALYPGTAANISFSVYAAAGAAFPSYDDLQFITELDDPAWMYTISVNGVKNTRPVTGGRTVTISGFELAYRNQDEVIVTVLLNGQIPSGAVSGTNRTLARIQELDSRGYAIPYSVVSIDHLIGDPTPPPTPAYGSITVTSSPPGADIYIDNVYKGLSPAVFDAVPNGNHVVRIRFEGYQDTTRSVSVNGDNRSVQVSLDPSTTVPITKPSPGQSVPETAPSPAVSMQPGYGSLSVTTSPPGALVYIDGAMKGITPATVPMLTEGTHSIVLVMDGFEDLSTSITINAGTTSEYITGLSKTKKTQGFSALIAAAAAGVLLLVRRRGI